MATYKLQVTSKLTDMYDLVPTKEFAMESISCPLTPKSHSLISPREFTRMFDGFTSVKKIKMPQFACNIKRQYKTLLVEINLWCR